MDLDLSSLEKAAASLSRALDRSRSAPDDEELRDACIQRFEYTFELCWKMIKRRLELDVASSSEIDGYSFRQLFRVAGERGLVADVSRWFDYRDKRNLTSHAYDERRAAEVYAVIPQFFLDAGVLIERLKVCDGA